MASVQYSSPVIQSQGSGYYNYYNIASRHKTDEVLEAWYHKDLSKEEIVANNTGILNKDSKDADLYRKLESVYRGVAESNRAKYSTVDELRAALSEKYSVMGHIIISCRKMVRVEECLTRIYTSGTLKQNQENSSNKSGNENVQCVYGNQFTTLDIDYVNYLKETVPKTTWNKDYLGELWSRKGEVLKNVREKNGTYDFDDIVTGAANAYSFLYREIIDGYDNGTRKVYVYDKESEGRRLLSKDEELEKLNAGFEELIKWDQMVAKSRMETEKALKKIKNTEFNADYSTCEVTDYIQETYLKYRQLYLNGDGKNNNLDINKLVSSVLNMNPDIHNYCFSLFTFAKVNCVV